MDAYCYLQAAGIVLGAILVLVGWFKLWVFIGELAEDRLDWDGFTVAMIGIMSPVLLFVLFVTVNTVANLLCP